MPEWDPEELKEAIATHSVVGYPVRTNLMGSGIIDQQIRPEKGGFVFYRVIADRPMTFKDFAQKIGADATLKTLKQWEQKTAYGSRTLPAMAVDLMETLEAGGKVSSADVLFRELMDRGCIDIDQNVFCFTFPSDDVVVSPAKTGMLVEVSSEGSTPGWPGRIVGFSKVEGHKIIRIEEFTPVPYMRTPEALLPAAVKKSDALPLSWTLGYGLLNAMEDAGVPVPPGKLSEDKQDYVLEKAIPISRIKEFCKEHHPDAELCLQHALMMTTLPLVSEEVTLRPFPEGTMAADVVVEITQIEDPEAIDVSWPEEESEEGEEWKG